MNEEDRKNLFPQAELKQRLQQLEAEIQAREEFSNVPLSKIRKNYWKICLLALVIVGLVTGYFMRDRQDDKLFSQYYEPYPNVVSYTERGGQAQCKIKSEALQLYENGHYGEALTRFESFPDSLKNQPDILFYSGISCIEVNKMEKAELYLQAVIQQRDQSFAAQSQWYLALVYLKKSQRQQAEKQLKQLTQLTDMYKDKANQLLNDL